VARDRRQAPFTRIPLSRTLTRAIASTTIKSEINADIRAPVAAHHLCAAVARLSIRGAFSTGGW
jgi:hypothetical protein